MFVRACGVCVGMCLPDTWLCLVLALSSAHQMFSFFIILHLRHRILWGLGNLCRSLALLFFYVFLWRKKKEELFKASCIAFCTKESGMFVVLQEQQCIVQQFIFLEEVNDNGPPEFPVTSLPFFHWRSEFMPHPEQLLQRWSGCGALLVGTLAADAWREFWY